MSLFNYQRRFNVPVFLLGFLLTFVGLDPGLDPFEDVLLVVYEHLTETSLWGADETAVAFGWFPPAFDVVPDTVGMRDIDKGVLLRRSHEKLNKKRQELGWKGRLTSLYHLESQTWV